MTVLVVLLVSWFVFRLLGGFGVPIFLSWHESVRYALAVMFLFTSVAHFNSLKHDLAGMIPAWLPGPLVIVTVTGIFEIAGAIGLMLPHDAHRIAAYCLMALLVPMFLANFHGARSGATLRGKPVTPLWLRAPMQLFFIALLWWSARP
ncbi:MAG TPA: DoxX family protein [Terracidiphilus sp.]|nr:DoxX family protein [Terracidiphilus sp.]